MFTPSHQLLRRVSKGAFHLTGIALMCALALWFVACGGPSANQAARPAPSPTSQPGVTRITMTARDFSFSLSSPIPAGLVDISLVNNGTQPHQAQLGRLLEGISPQQVIAAFQVSQQQGLALLTLVGGPDVVAPGLGQEVILNLSPGQYATICLVVGADGVPHVMKGMISFFTVTASSNHPAASAPQEDGTLRLNDSGYALPENIRSGSTLLKVTNRGTRTHETAIVQLAPGKSIADVLAFLRAPSGPPLLWRSGAWPDSPPAPPGG